LAPETYRVVMASDSRDASDRRRRGPDRPHPLSARALAIVGAVLCVGAADSAALTHAMPLWVCASIAAAGAICLAIAFRDQFVYCEEPRNTHLDSILAGLIYIVWIVATTPGR
jgi:hypothetical protein